LAAAYGHGHIQPLHFNDVGLPMEPMANEGVEELDDKIVGEFQWF
jgi:hypothetical protein